MNLTQFLAQNPVNDLTEEVTVSSRLADPESGELYKFKIKAVSGDEFADYQRRCTTFGKKGKVDFNTNKLNQLLILNHTLVPNFRDAAAIQEAGCTSPEQYLNKVLTAGEIISLAQAISELSGFDRDVEELIDEVKN